MKINNNYEETRKDPLFKMLEKIITRNWWENQIFNKKEFFIYCNAVKCEAQLFNQEFIESEKYKKLLNMKNEELREYLFNDLMQKAFKKELIT